MAFENGLAISSDRVVRVDDESLWKDVLSVEVGALQFTQGGKWDLVPHAVRNVRGKETPLIPASEFLCCEAECADLILLPIASPLLQSGLNVPVKVTIGVAVETFTTSFLCGRLSVTNDDHRNRIRGSLSLGDFAIILSVLGNRFDGLLLLANPMSFTHLGINPSICNEPHCC